MTVIPMVIEQDARGERAFDIYSRLNVNVAGLYAKLGLALLVI
jgi:hypothetical protein